MLAPPPRLLRTRSLPVSRETGIWDRRRGRRPGQLLAGGRAAALVLWSLLSIPVQTVLLAVPGSAKTRFAQIYWSVFCRLLGVGVRVVGESRHAPARPVVYVSNHTSWLDVGILGAKLPACFVSKGDVAAWPLVNVIAWLGRTVYVSRQRGSTMDESRAMRRRLQGGDNLILFPEGTTSDGSRVLPFRSSLLSIAEGEPAPLVQPVSVVFDRLAGLPAVRSTRPLFAYYGDMSIGPHFWRLAQCRGVRATLLLHEPLDPRDYADRKALTRAVWAAVAGGASALRQNRPAIPRETVPAADAAFA